MSLKNYLNIKLLRDLLDLKFPYLTAVFDRQYSQFGDQWAERFERELSVFFEGNENLLAKAARGYGAFCLDSMKLQVKFNKTKEYENKTYEEAASEVYQNEDYMFGLYLPGILISHFLWEHHYLQHLFFSEELVPLGVKLPVEKFYDVGVGTGFYSREFLRCWPACRGEGFDMSPHSLNHTKMLLQKWNFSGRYTTNLGDITRRERSSVCDLVNSIEVLEHLEDPQSFLRALNEMLRPGGLGFISAAINAPNADHIYLYRSYEEVGQQIEAAGFRVLKYCNDRAYDPRYDGELVPINAAFIVSKD